MMPVMDGSAFVAAIARDARLASIPIVLLSANGMLPRLAGVRSLHKPISCETLLGLAAHHCRRKDMPS
jgi:CheY-like chemotaxis protein